MPRQKYVELILTDGDSRLESIPNHALNGYELVSDYRADGKRHLFLKRAESETEPALKKKKTSKRVSKPVGHESTSAEVPNV